MATAAWTYLIADLVSGIIIDELPLTGVKMSKILNGSGQLQANIQLGDAKISARDVKDLTTPVRRVVYAIRDARPWWGGIIWSRAYDEDTKQVTIGCADLWSYFDHRKVLDLLGAAPYAPTYIAGFSKVFTQQDQNTIAAGLVNLAQTHPSGNVGIVTDTSLSGILRDRTYDGFNLDYTGQELRDLSQLQTGPDMLFDLGGLGADGRPSRIMRIGTPRLGQQGTPHRWDLGGNMLSYTWETAGGVMSTRTFAQGAGQDRGTTIAVAEDASRYADGWPLLETDDIFQDISVQADLQEQANTTLSGLKLPVATPTLKVRGDMAPTLGEYGPGDDAQMVIPVGNLWFPAGLNLRVRMLGIQVEVNDDGRETVTLSCQSQQVVI